MCVGTDDRSLLHPAPAKEGAMSHKKDAAQLLSALKLRDASQVLHLLSRCSSQAVNVVDESGRTPLHLAVTLDSQSAVSIIESLVTRGASMDVPNAHRTTPLQKAVLGNPFHMPEINTIKLRKCMK